jgi:transcriptional antiterminator NusG
VAETADAEGAEQAEAEGAEQADAKAAEQADAQAVQSSDVPAAEDQGKSGSGGEEQEGISLASREGMRWYVLRVASNKEDQVCQALSRKVKIEGLEERIGRILVPTQKEKRMRGGSVRVVERKLYPGYVFVEMATEEDGAVPENVWFMVKETTGVGDFIGSGGKPTPMRDYDVEKMLRAAERREEQPGLGIPFKKGDRVKVREGSFENYEGDVDTIDEQKGMVTVLLTIFGRATPVDVEYWLLERV